LLVIQKLCVSGRDMCRSNTRSRRLDGQHLTVLQPIVRGQEPSNVNFDSEVAISVVDGYARLE
jgi:hypothetical protein